MKALRLALLMGILAAATASAQAPREEISQLRQFLEVEDSLGIQLANSPSLPAASPLRVFFALGLDMGVRDNFHKWLKQWNGWDAQKYGAIVPVSTIDSAEVILVRIRAAGRPSQQTATSDGLLILGGQAVPVARTYSYDTLPVAAYILRRSPRVLEIASRYVGTAPAEEDGDSGRELWDSFKKLLKAKERKSSGS